jgi:hypothetical protein
MKTSILLKDLPFFISSEEISKKLNILDDENNKIIKNLTKESERLAVPKAIFKECFIDDRGDNFVVLNGIKFNSRVISVNLSKIDRAFPYIVTCGTEIKHWSDSKKDKFEKKTAELITQEILIQCHSFLKKHIERNFNTGNLSRVNPGSTIDWELKEQKSIFNILGDNIKLIGVTIDSNFFMNPNKTYSGLYFHNETNYKNCYTCNANNCSLREENYDSTYYDRYYYK